MSMAGRLKIISTIVASLLTVLTALTILPRHVTAQSNSCTEAISDCNYEFTTNGVTPSFVNAQAVITSTMTVQSYGTGNQSMFSLQYNPDYPNMVCNNLERTGN